MRVPWFFDWDFTSWFRNDFFFLVESAFFHILFGLLSSSYIWTFVSLFFFNFYIPFLFGIFFLFFLFFISFLVLFQFFFNSIAVTHLGFFKVFFFIIIPPCYCRNNKIRVYFCIYKMTLISKWSYIFDQQSE